MDIQKPNLTCEGHTDIYGGSAVRNHYMWNDTKILFQSPIIEENAVNSNFGVGVAAESFSVSTRCDALIFAVPRADHAVVVIV